MDTMNDFPGENLLDFSGIEAMDPSIVEGFRLLYEREVPLEIRTQSFDGELTKPNLLESIKVKVLAMGSSDSPQTVRVELSSEADLFFHYIHCIEDNDFARIKESQKLMVAFNDYPTVLVRMLNACIREPHTHFGIFVLLNENDARLDFIQNMEYKYIELMSCNCIQSPSELVQQHISYRYNAMKQKLAIMQSRLHEINTLVKTKNPSLLLQLNRNVPNSPGASSTNSSINRR